MERRCEILSVEGNDRGVSPKTAIRSGRNFVRYGPQFLLFNARPGLNSIVDSLIYSDKHLRTLTDQGFPVISLAVSVVALGRNATFCLTYSFRISVAWTLPILKGSC